VRQNVKRIAVIELVDLNLADNINFPPHAVVEYALPESMHIIEKLREAIPVRAAQQRNHAASPCLNDNNVQEDACCRISAELSESTGG